MARRCLLTLLCLLMSRGAAAGQDTARPEAPPRTSFASLFTELPADTARLAAPGNLLILAIGGALSAASHPADASTTRRLSEATSLDGVLRPGNAIGNGGTQAGLALGTWLVGRATHHTRLAETGADLLRAQMLNGAVTQGLKVAVGRERPDGGARSFPSGHTSATAATAAVLWAHGGWKAGVPAATVSALVGLSRIHDRRHHLSDVVFGGALGLAAGRAVTVGHGRGRMALSPFAVAGGGGVRVKMQRKDVLSLHRGAQAGERPPR